LAPQVGSDCPWKQEKLGAAPQMFPVAVPGHSKDVIPRFAAVHVCADAMAGSVKLAARDSVSARQPARIDMG
jgi:hypothetical protein